MKCLWNWLACCGVLLALGLEVTAAEQAPSHVVVICIDGLPSAMLDDPNATMPTIRQLVAKGVRAEGMKVSNPSVTWPNHTSLVTGVRPEKHGVLFNGVLEKPGPGLPVRTNPKTDKSELVHAPTIYEALHAQGRPTVAINWPCTRNSGTLAVDFPDSPDTLNYTTPEFLKELQDEGILTEEQRANFSKILGTARDEIWTRAAAHALKTRKPPLLFLHLLNLDSSHHRYGPQTLGGYSAIAAADRWVNEILLALDEAGMRERTTVFIVADHGFMAIPKTLQPNVTLRKAGLLTVEGNSVTAARVNVIPEGGIGMVYLNVPASEEADRAQVLELFRDHEGISDILQPEDFSKYGLPDPAQYEQMADLILVAADGYGFNATATGDEAVVTSTGTLGTHGFLSDNPKMNAIFVASGHGIAPGAQLGLIENIDVTPTISHLLSVPFPGADGRVLTEILTPAVSATR